MCLNLTLLVPEEDRALSPSEPWRLSAVDSGAGQQFCQQLPCMAEFAQTNFPACARGAMSEGGLVHRNLVKSSSSSVLSRNLSRGWCTALHTDRGKATVGPKALDKEVHLASNPELTGLADSQGTLGSCLCSDPSPCCQCGPKEQMWCPGAGRRRLHVI